MSIRRKHAELSNYSRSTRSLDTLTSTLQHALQLGAASSIRHGSIHRLFAIRWQTPRAIVPDVTAARTLSCHKGIVCVEREGRAPPNVLTALAKVGQRSSTEVEVRRARFTKLLRSVRCAHTRVHSRFGGRRCCVVDSLLGAGEVFFVGYCRDVLCNQCWVCSIAFILRGARCLVARVARSRGADATFVCQVDSHGAR